MNVETIAMPREQARAKLREYRKGLHRKADAEWERAATAYEQLAKGYTLIFLADAIQGAPQDDQGRPRLAIARADREECRIEMQTQAVLFATAWRYGQSGPMPRDSRITVPLPGAGMNYRYGYSLVPIVPPDVQRGHDLSKHFVLWEVEAWAASSLVVRPDRDPYLLRRIDADLYAVVGEWDLTDVERAVMRGRIGA